MSPSLCSSEGGFSQAMELQINQTPKLKNGHRVQASRTVQADDHLLFLSPYFYRQTHYQLRAQLKIAAVSTI